jgi:hypothetical protein
VITPPQPVPSAGSGVPLSLVSGYENIGLQRHRATDMNGVHAAQHMGFETRHSLR